MWQRHAGQFRTCGQQKAKKWRTGKHIAMLTFSSTKCLGRSGRRLQAYSTLAASLCCVLVRHTILVREVSRTVLHIVSL